MSLARYLANLLNSSGQVEAAKLAATLDLSSKTLTYPDNSVQSADIASLAASKLSGQVPDANAPVGSVIQVVNYTYTTQVSTSSTSFIATGMGGSITPSSASSKILVLFTVNGYITNSAYDVFTVYRNGSVNIGGATWGFGNLYGNSGDRFGQVSGSKLDSPATVSSVNYSVWMRVSSSIGYLNLNNETSTMTLLEIAE